MKSIYFNMDPTISKASSFDIKIEETVQQTVQ